MQRQTIRFLVMIMGATSFVLMAFLVIRETPRTSNEEKLAGMLDRNPIVEIAELIVGQVSIMSDDISAFTKSIMCASVKKVKPLKIAFELSKNTKREAYSVFIPREKTPPFIAKEEEDDDCIV